nr:OmpA family protein [Pinirhizobacter soli]
MGSLAACVEAPRHASSPSAEPSIAFPDPAGAAIPGGVFVDTSKLAQVQPGLARSQVYALLGMPHFHEGMDAPHWNYVFNYRDDADQVQQCQFLVAFDTDDRVNDMHWQPDGCQERLLAKATKAPPIARWQPKAPVVTTPPPALVPAPAAPVPAEPVVAAATAPPPITTTPAAPVAAPTPTPTAPLPSTSPPATPPPPVAPTAAAPVATPTPAASPSTTIPPASDVTLAATSQASLPSPATAPAPPVPTAASTPAAIPATSPAPVPAPTAQVIVASSASTASAPLAPMPPVTLSSDAAFAPGSAKLTHAGRERLDMMLLSVQVPTQFHELQVVGFSDRTGTAKNNLKLSQRRAEAVRRYLVEGGVPADSITAIGKGEREPKAECGKKKGKALSECLAPDRRVEINGLAPDAISH